MTTTPKTCTKCKQIKDVTSFSTSKKAKDGLHTQCRACVNEAVKAYRKNNPEYAKKNQDDKDKRVSAKRQFVWDYLMEHPCEACGITDPRIMDFDHIDPSTKSAEVGYLIHRSSMETLKAEIAKCRVLCANCHRIRSGYQMNYWWVQFE